MTPRNRWQYCQVQVSGTNGVLKQFFAERPPVETDLHTGWPAMVAKLGEQGWEMVGVAPQGRDVVYVFKREMPGAAPAQPVPAAMPAPPAPPAPPDEPPPPAGPVTDFTPL